LEARKLRMTRRNTPQPRVSTAASSTSAQLDRNALLGSYVALETNLQYPRLLRRTQTRKEIVIREQAFQLS